MENLQYANDQIEKACRQLTSRNNEKQDIINAATKIAEYTSEICNSGRNASSLITGKDYNSQTLSTYRGGRIVALFFFLNFTFFNLTKIN